MNTEKIAYLAGILDGEGCFSIVFHKTQNRYYALVGVMNTSTILMKWLQENFGGSVYIRNQPSNKPHWKTRYEWKIYTFHLDSLIPKVIPFLVIKSEHAKILMKLRESLVSREPVNKQERAIYRHSLHSQLKTLNL